MGPKKWQIMLTFEFSTIHSDVGWVGGSEKVRKCADVIRDGPLVEVGICYKVISVGLWRFFLSHINNVKVSVFV